MVGLTLRIDSRFESKRADGGSVNGAAVETAPRSMTPQPAKPLAKSVL